VSVELLTLRALAESAQSAATLAGLGDEKGAKEALARAEHRLELFTAGRPSHARSVRLASEAVSRARRAVEILGSHADTAREKQTAARAAARAAERAKA
jgi:hypothetical protein